MGIVFDEGRRAFHVQTARMSYVMMVTEAGKLVHVYWGERLPSLACVEPLLDGLRGARSQGGIVGASAVPEYRCQEPMDFGEPALLAVHADGVRSTRLTYAGHEVSADGTALTVRLRDEYYAFEVSLSYRVFGELDLVSRRATVRNGESGAVTLDCVKSATAALPVGPSYRATHFAGNWGSEFTRQSCMVTQGQLVLESHRLTCAAHQHVPFVALDPRGESTETMGEVYFAVLKWSGDFKLSVEQDYYGQVTVTAGVNDLDCRLRLEPGESFETPELVLGYSGAGFERMSELLYDWQLDWEAPRAKAHGIRPIIYNSWYPYEFDIDEGRLLGLVGKAADIGAELFVIDDGWMPKRTDDRAGLGDWVADPARFPHGLGVIADACHERGLLFGLWVEPEMCNPDSELYRAHPDWVVSDATRPRSECRHQVILDVSREEVCQWCIEWLDRLIRDCRLDYLKWDMNRYATELGTDRALSVRYIRNLYRIWESLNERHPEVLFENCASGGGRADFGMVPYADRINRSDNAHPQDVMVLHEGFSRLFVPKTAGGAGNIARDPNVPLPFRIHLGMTGSMSIGIDLLKADESTLAQLREATAAFKLVRADLQDAYVYRIASATEHPYVIWQYVRRDRRTFGLFAFGHCVRQWDRQRLPRFRMRGLLPDAVYVDGRGVRHTGAEMMLVGVPVSLAQGDYTSSFQFFGEG